MRGVVSEGDGRDFFVSYTGVNESWARWICVQLEQAGYTTVSQALDFRPGQDFVHAQDREVSAFVECDDLRLQVLIISMQSNICAELLHDMRIGE